jgi:hypothetical protein
VFISAPIKNPEKRNQELALFEPAVRSLTTCVFVFTAVITKAAKLILLE